MDCDVENAVVVACEGPVNDAGESADADDDGVE